MNILKKIYYSVLLLTTLLTTTNCESFLDVDNVGKSDIDTFFKELDGLRAAVPGMYSVLYTFYDNEFLKYPEVAGNMLRMRSTASSASMIDQYNFTSDPTQETSAVGYLWKRGYVVMSNTNNILEYAPALKSDYPNNVTEIDNIRAQALFVRALMHFNLCLCYGQPYGYTADNSHWGICVLTRLPASGESILRNTVKQAYNRVITDLTDALKLFGSDYKSDVYHASPLACKALLARVYLYMDEWELADKYANEVIAESRLTERKSYVDMFNANEIGDEAILRLAGYGNGKQKIGRAHV